MALSAAASFSLSTPTSLLTLLFIPASAPALPLPGAWTSAPASTFSFPEICYNMYSSQAMHREGRHWDKWENLLLALFIMSICMRGLYLILSKVDTRTSWGRRWNISSRQGVGGLGVETGQEKNTEYIQLIMILQTVFHNWLLSLHHHPHSFPSHSNIRLLIT